MQKASFKTIAKLITCLVIKISFLNSEEFQYMLNQNQHFSVRQAIVLPFLEYQAVSSLMV